MESEEDQRQHQDIYDEVRAYYNKHLKLNTRNWLNDIHDPSEDSGIVEVRFKNTHKAFYKNTHELPLRDGDVVAVESPVGHDIGVVSLTGFLARRQFERKIRKRKGYKFLSIYRHARVSDIEKWREAKKREHSVRTRAREIASELGLQMKISDVEIQGDNTKATFYYLAEGRVDFRELIRHYAREFQFKVEMKQIGARQEAAMIGAIGSSGREICGSAWKTDFESVKIAAAKIQQLPSNSQKLMDHSGKLKASLMYELDTYLEAWKYFPNKLPVLETAAGTYYPHKTDVLRRKVWYSIASDSIMNPVEVSLHRIREIEEENRKGNKPPLSTEDTSDEMQQSFSVGSADVDDYPSKPHRKKKSNKKRRKRKARSQ